jgi:hypothetical protein
MPEPYPCYPCNPWFVRGFEKIVASVAPKENQTTDHTDKSDEKMIHEELRGNIIGEWFLTAKVVVSQ